MKSQSETTSFLLSFFITPRKKKPLLPFFVPPDANFKANQSKKRKASSFLSTFCLLLSLFLLLLSFYWPTPLTSCSSPFIAMVLAYKFGHAWARIGAVWVSSMGVMWSSGEVVAWGKEERQVVHACWRVCCHMKGGSHAWSW